MVALATRTVDILIDAEIGCDGFACGIRRRDIDAELKKITAVNEVRVWFNSPGGGVFDGLDIIAAFEQYKTKNPRVQIVGHIAGMAASIAAVIATSISDKLVMHKGGQLMFHGPYTGAVGGAQTFSRLAKRLLKVQDDLIAQVENGRPNASVDIDELFESPEIEHWFNAKEAVAAGLADEIAEPARRSGMEIAKHRETIVARYSPPKGLLDCNCKGTCGKCGESDRSKLLKAKLDAVLGRTKPRNPAKELRQKLLQHRLNKILNKPQRDASEIIRDLRDTVQQHRAKKAKQQAAINRYVNAAPADMRANVRRLYAAWQTFNKRFFEDRLRVPDIRIDNEFNHNARGSCGMKDGTTIINLHRAYFVFSGPTKATLKEAYQRRVETGEEQVFGYEEKKIRKAYGRDPQDAWTKCLWTLLHEMCHQSVKENKSTICDGHGDNFTAEVNRVGKMLGLPDHKPTYDRTFQSYVWPSQVKEERLPQLQAA